MCGALARAFLLTASKITSTALDNRRVESTARNAQRARVHVEISVV
jgi:hypothetical protein